MRPNTEISICSSGLHRPLLFLLLVLDFASSSFHPSPLLGVAPQDEEYYASEVIACRDGSRSFVRDRLNDGFCDCPDGTDEPGTSACPESKFYCRNLGDRTRILFSSRVNDQICDCCDGSDEYDGRIICADTCSKKDIIAAVMKAKNAHDMETENSGQLSVFENETTIGFKENIESIKDLRIAIILEFVVAASLLTCCIFHWWPRYNRRHRRLKI